MVRSLLGDILPQLHHLVLLVVLGHRTVANEGVIAAWPHAVEVLVRLVVVTVRSSTVNSAVEELKSIEDVNVAVEVLSVQVQHISPVSGMVTPRADTVEVGLGDEDAAIIRTRFKGGKLLEASDEGVLRPISTLSKLIRNLAFRHLDLGYDGDFSLRVLGRSASATFHVVTVVQGAHMTSRLAGGSGARILVDLVMLKPSEGRISRANDCSTVSLKPAGQQTFSSGMSLFILKT